MNIAPASDRKLVPPAEIAHSFLKLGSVDCGGPAAHIAMMEEEFVRKRGWLTKAEG